MVRNTVLQLRTERHILVIEDNAGDVRLVREALKQTYPPVTLDCIADCEDALLFLRREGRYQAVSTPNLILLDFNVPGSDPRGFLRDLKQDESLWRIPVAVFTTSDAERDVRQAYSLNANCFLLKPGSLDDFFRTIQAAAHFWLDVAYVPGK